MNKEISKEEAIKALKRHSLNKELCTDIVIEALTLAIEALEHSHNIKHDNLSHICDKIDGIIFDLPDKIKLWQLIDEYAKEALEQKPSGEGGKGEWIESKLDELLIKRGEHPTRVRNPIYGEERELAKFLLHEFHNQFPSVKQCGCMTHCNCPIFQPPVISDEEIEKHAKNYSHDKSEQIDFTLGMKVMRKLLTNKEY